MRVKNQTKKENNYQEIFQRSQLNKNLDNIIDNLRKISTFI